MEQNWSAVHWFANSARIGWAQRLSANTLSADMRTLLWDRSSGCAALPVSKPRFRCRRVFANQPRPAIYPRPAPEDRIETSLTFLIMLCSLMAIGWSVRTAMILGASLPQGRL